MNKMYLGDGVYAELSDGRLVLTTSDGITDTNTIWLEPEVVVALRDYIIRNKERLGIR